MRFMVFVLILCGMTSRALCAGVAPVPESEQAAQASAIIDAYHGSRPVEPPKKLHVFYFTPADREPAARYEQRLDPILEDIRAFYRGGMQRLGFGAKTFSLPRDAQGKLIIHLVKGKEPESAFPRWLGRNGGNTGAPEGGEIVKRECQPAMQAAGLAFEHETILIFCHLATYDEKAGTFRHHSPYFGSWDQESGLCFAADWSAQDLENLTRKEPKLNDGEYGDMSLGKHMTIFIGGIAHELGHAFALPHCGERWDERALGTSLMGAGNHTYHDERRGQGKGSFLTMASGMHLAARPLFNGSAKGEAEPGRLQRCVLNLSTNLTRADLSGRKSTLRVEGTAVGSPPIYGVIAYFDSFQDGGYHAPTATTVPDAEGRFAIEVSDLAPCGNGDLRVEFCHANGAISQRQLGFSVTRDGGVDLSQWEVRKALAPIADAVARDQLEPARAALAELAKSGSPEGAKVIASNLVDTLRQESKPNPADVPATVQKLPLGDARAQSAEVAWLKPAANRVPQNDEIPSPLLDSGKLYATGLYAHATSRYVFNLDGKWKELTGEAGLHTAHQAHGSVVFIIKTDGHEAFRSAVIRGGKKAKYQVDVSGVKSLELIVDPAGDGKAGDWGLWLDPMLSR